MSKASGNVTIKSIAEALGISFSTVSKALNGDPAISPQTRQMVEEKARQMNYTRNYFAQNLRQKGSKTVAVIANDTDILAYSEMIAGISAKLAVYGYTTIVSDPLYSEEFERSSIQNVLTRMPEAVIVSPADPAGDNLQLLRHMFPTTLVLGDVTGIADTNSVVIDHYLAGTLSAGHMLQNNIQNNLIFGGPEGYQASERFLAGIRDTYARYGLEFPENAVYRFRPDLQTAYRRFLRIWQEQPGAYNGVICFCDSIAFGIYRAARELGLSIPDDVSVIGYDDSPINEFTDPPLTTIHVPKDLVATHCAQFIINRLIGNDTQLYTYNLQPYLADRGSVRKAPKKK